MNYVEQIKIKPDKILEERLNLLINISRFTYNWILGRTLKLNRKPFKKEILNSRNEFRALVRESLMCNKDGEIYPQEFQDILKTSPSQISDLVCDDIDRAWKTLKKNKEPSFKCKDNSRQSFTLHKKTSSTFKFEDTTLKVAKMKFHLRGLRFLREASQIKRVSIIKSTYGWYINIL